MSLVGVSVNGAERPEVVRTTSTVSPFPTFTLPPLTDNLQFIISVARRPLVPQVGLGISLDVD